MSPIVVSPEAQPVEAASTATTGFPEELLAVETLVHEFARDEDKAGVNDLLQSVKSGAVQTLQQEFDTQVVQEPEPASAHDEPAPTTQGLPLELLAVETLVQEFAVDDDQNGVNDWLQADGHDNDGMLQSESAPQGDNVATLPEESLIVESAGDGKVDMSAGAIHEQAPEAQADGEITGLPEEVLVLEAYAQEFARDDDQDGVNDLLQSEPERRSAQEAVVSQPGESADHTVIAENNPSAAAVVEANAEAGLPAELLAVEQLVQDFARDDDQDGINDLLQEEVDQPSASADVVEQSSSTVNPPTTPAPNNGAGDDAHEINNQGRSDDLQINSEEPNVLQRLSDEDDPGGVVDLQPST